MYSLVIPVYRNEESIPDLLDALGMMNRKLGGGLAVTFVVDGSPDKSFDLLRYKLADQPFSSRLVLLSRNFGSFSAIRTGLAMSKGPYYAVMAADLQEPPDLITSIFKEIETGNYDVAMGQRAGRADPGISRFLSEAYWGLYRWFIQPEMPPGGVDIFGCNETFKEHLLDLHESNTSLVGLIFWLGFRRKLIAYQRQPRKKGKSAWTLQKKLKYFSDSVYAFSDLPIRLLTTMGIFAVFISVFLGSIVLYSKLSGQIQVPGYAAMVIVIVFFAGLNSMGLGIVGSYVWRTFENTKGRPGSAVLFDMKLGGGNP